MSFNHGAVWWSELMTRDVPGALAYYKTVCGWSFDKMPMQDGSDYHIAIAHGKPIAGIMDMSAMDEHAEVPPHWFTYFAVDDVDVAMDQTRFAGGEIRRPPMHVPGVGRIAIVVDPSGAAAGIMTPEFPGDELVAADAAAEAGPEPEDDLDEDNFPV